MDIRRPSEPFDDFDPRNFDAHSDWVADGLVHQMRHAGAATGSYEGPNYRTILLMAAKKVGARIGRCVVTTDRATEHTAGTIYMRVADWSDDSDGCICADVDAPRFPTVCLDGRPHGFVGRITTVHQSRRSATRSPN